MASAGELPALVVASAARMIARAATVRSPTAVAASSSAHRCGWPSSGRRLTRVLTDSVWINGPPPREPFANALRSQLDLGERIRGLMSGPTWTSG
jgi:hypothetical protein